ncbi:Spore germination protein YndE [compost metagenome]
MGRMGELAIPWVFLFSFILFISVSPKIDFNKIQPFVENGIKPILHGSIACIAFPFLELVVLLMIIPSVNKPQKIRKSFLQGALIGGGIVFILIVMCILVIGADLVQYITYPSYSLARKINIGGFFERVEAMITLMWILTLFMKVSIHFYVFNIGLAQLFKLKEYRMLSLPTGLLMIVLSTVIAPNIVYYNQILSEYWPYFDITYGLILPLLLLGVYYLRKLFKGHIQT